MVEGIKRALVASIFARAWAALLGLAAIPIYVRLLGVEAYGLIGFFSSIQALITFLDLGLGATLIRDLARLGSSPDGKRHARDTTRTFEATYFFVAMLIGVTLVFFGSTLVHYWVKLDVLDPALASRAFVLGGLALALQWPAGLYASGMAGLHKQTQLSVATSVFATLRIVLTVGILSLVNPTLEAFFWAQITWALVQSVGMRFMLWRSLKLKEHKPLIKLSIVREKLHFAGGMTGIALTSIVLTQMDKLVMSHTLALKDFGVYVLSSTLAFGLYMVISPLFSVIYPRFSALIHAGNDQTVAEQFHLGSQMMAVLVIPAAVTIALFSKQILYIWTGNISISEQGAGVLSLLVIGNACNGIMNIPYALQLASGWTSLSFWINVGAILFLTPATWFFATKYGAIGGAAVWCTLNVGYVFLTPHLMHKRLLQTEKMSWYMRDIFPPVLVAAAAIVLLWGVDLSGLSWLQLAICITFFWVASTMFSLLVLQRLRERFATYVTIQVLRWLKHG